MITEAMAEQTEVELIVPLVASGWTVRDAAKEVGMSERSAYRLSARADFRERVHRIRMEAVRAIQGRLVESGIRAIQTLEELCEDGPPAVRVAAAKTILGKIADVSSNLEFRERLQEVEAMQKELQLAPSALDN